YRPPASLGRPPELPNPQAPGFLGRVGPGRSEAPGATGVSSGEHQSPARRGGRGRSVCIVPAKPGNLYRGDPVEGRGAPRPGAVVGKPVEDTEPRSPVHAPATDSEAEKRSPDVTSRRP